MLVIDNADWDLTAAQAASNRQPWMISSDHDRADVAEAF
jgi:hypothetical protein